MPSGLAFASVRSDLGDLPGYGRALEGILGNGQCPGRLRAQRTRRAGDLERGKRWMGLAPPGSHAPSGIPWAQTQSGPLSWSPRRCLTSPNTMRWPHARRMWLICRIGGLRIYWYLIHENPWAPLQPTSGNNARPSSPTRNRGDRKRLRGGFSTA